MNTESLQQAFPEVYRDFFSKCSIVTSTCISFSWGTSHAWRIGSPAIYQKLPLKVYVGLTPNDKTNTIERGDSLVFSPIEQKFCQPEEEEVIAWNKITEFLPSIIKREIVHENKFNGFTIHILYELPEEHAFAPINITGNLIPLIYLYFHKLSIDNLRKITKEPCSKLMDKQDSLGKDFNKLDGLIWKAAVVSGWNLTSSVQRRSSLIQSFYPVISFTEKRGGDTKDWQGTGAPLNLSDNPNYAKKINRWVFRMEELFNLETASTFPLDVAFIYPGFGRLYKDSYDYTDNFLAPSFKDLASFTEETFDEHLKKYGPDHLPDFVKDYKETRKNNFWLRYLQVGSILTLKLLKAFKDLYEQRASEGVVKDFLKANVDINRVWNTFAEDSSKNMQYISHKITAKARETAGGIDIATRFHNYGKLDGDIMIIAPYQKFRKALIEVIEDLQKNYNEDICLDYASWIDGWGEDGIKVEQFIGQNIFSKYITKNSVLKKSLTKENKVTTRALPKNDVNKEEADIFLDSINNKIYLQGKSTNSKDLPSQKTTIDILKILLDKPNQRVSNKELPTSSYTSQRNELQSKIIGPLKKLVKEKLGKNLDLKVEGSLANFHVQLNPSDVKINLIDKLGT